MYDESRERKQRFGFKWIKSESSGETYLCPLGAFNDRQFLIEQQLESVCVKESHNPQNN
jgi:hypothetical protein